MFFLQQVANTEVYLKPENDLKQYLEVHAGFMTELIPPHRCQSNQKSTQDHTGSYRFAEYLLHGCTI
jgi:hypothetical protein